MAQSQVICLDAEAKDWQDAITLCSNAFINTGFVKESFKEACIEREKTFPTGLPVEPPVAIPHADSIHVKKTGICFLRLKNPVPFCRMDAPEERVNVDLIFNLAIKDSDSQVKTLQRLIQAVQNHEFLSNLYELEEDSLIKMIEEELIL